MKNHDPHIESLLEQFMQGDTTLEQEQELSKYFSCSTSIPEDWEAYRVMFAYFDAAMPITEQKPKRNTGRALWTLLAAAAVAAIAIMVAPLFQRTSSVDKTTTPQPITAVNKNVTIPDTAARPVPPETSHLLVKQEQKSTKKKPHATSHHATISTLDSIEREREQGEVEQAQQELMANKFIIEQERQEALNEQYITRAQAYQAQQAAINENPQFIQVVFK